MIKIITFLLLLTSCSTTQYFSSTSKLVMRKFTGKWFIHGSRDGLFFEGQKNLTVHFYQNDKKELVSTFKFKTKDLKVINQDIQVFEPLDQTPHIWRHNYLWPLHVDYLVLDIDELHQWAIIGDTQGKNIWIISRMPEMIDEEFSALLTRANESGYNTLDVMRMEHRHD